MFSKKIIHTHRAAKEFSGNFFEAVGNGVLQTFESVGIAAQISAETLVWIFKGKINIRNTVAQIVEVGWRSFPIVALTSFFTGMVLALQVGTATTTLFNEPVYVGTIVGFSLVIELGPVLTAIVVTGRVGAAITAEIGTMKVTEQLDALQTLGTNPVKYLAVPRYIACILMLPLLTALANIIGIYGGFVMSNTAWNMPASVYMRDVLDFMSISTFMHGLIKSFFFGALIAIISCFKGFATTGGAEGVGKATTGAVMVSLVLILVSDYFLTSMLVAFGIK
ncbi:MAG: ABC transporter permease [Elusimicrobia bacterium]|nr:ABC transporter permease [Elusimicrobiota bacterium]